MDHAATTDTVAVPQEEHQQHPIKLYLTVWIWLFVLSVGSYMVDIVNFEGLLRWGLIVTLMLLKAGLIIAVFMHMAWERLALSYAILVPPVLILVFVAMMAVEATYTEWMRVFFLNGGT
ncbi:cytochrome C oxidase subunit IV family protein [Devosia nitrariae]|uniref:Cytochrome c oxidase subunit IV n=1 Tax=Devosia nitrariae TaxID=2071872 RepID=A0ABQ5W8E0_9HYPH|nr:cytochrome C oxidase subunit IV family protein [Devosia nitrariae]GLQ56375.1 cytochrome c oxidase subunit IV [Devosia nitrariae]